MKRKLRSSIAPEDTYKMWPVTCHVHVADLKETAQVPPLPTVLLMPILDIAVIDTRPTIADSNRHGRHKVILPARLVSSLYKS